MKKVLLVIGIIVSFLLIYLIYKTFVVFGFWNLIWTFLVNLFFGLIFGQFIGSRKVEGEKIIYNPKEWPKLIHIVSCILTAYYLYTVISSEGVSNSDYIFGIIYLSLLSGSGIFMSTYRIIRDRNDFVEFDKKTISYRDNYKNGTFEIEKIEKISGSLTLHFKDGSEHFINLKEMNFNVKDLIGLSADLIGLLPKKEEKIIN